MARLIGKPVSRLFINFGESSFIVFDAARRIHHDTRKFSVDGRIAPPRLTPGFGSH